MGHREWCEHGEIIHMDGNDYPCAECDARGAAFRERLSELEKDAARLDWMILMFERCEYAPHYSSLLRNPRSRADIDAMMSTVPKPSLSVPSVSRNLRRKSAE